MRFIGRLGQFNLLAPALAISGAFAAKPSQLAEARSHKGLQKLSVKGLDLAYAQPCATLAGAQARAARAGADGISARIGTPRTPPRAGNHLPVRRGAAR